MDTLELVKEIAEEITYLGGTAYFVGGTVRDKMLDLPVKDFDIEVHGLSKGALEAILVDYDADFVGKSFGVYKVGQDIDISLPRTEEKTGEGHKGFTVTVDPDLGITEAARRRDFTINAMYKNVLTDEFFDPFNGNDDLIESRLEIVDPETFVEDSLRVLRGAQFAGRFSLRPSDRTIVLMNSISLADLPAERIQGELNKLFTSVNVIAGLNVLFSSGAKNQLFPSVVIPYNAMRTASLISATLKEGEQLALVYAVFLSETNDYLGVLDRLQLHSVNGFDVRKHVIKMVEAYREPAPLTDADFRKLSLRVDMNLYSLFQVAKEHNVAFRDRVTELGLLHETPKPILMGRHLMAEGFDADKKLGKVLDKVFELQLEGKITDLDGALTMARSFYQ